MATARVKATLVSVVLLAFTMALLWQQARINRLRAEATDLRVQLGQVAPAAAENRQLPDLQPSTQHPLVQDNLGELLRLRGQVGVLRRQLADARRLTPNEENLQTPEQPLRRKEPDMAALETVLTAQQAKVDAVKQKAEQLLTALNIPEDVARMNGDALAHLSAESLEHYTPYFQAKREQQELERFAAILKMKMEMTHIETQESPPRRSSQ